MATQEDLASRTAAEAERESPLEDAAGVRGDDGEDDTDNGEVLREKLGLRYRNVASEADPEPHEDVDQSADAPNKEKRLRGITRRQEIFDVLTLPGPFDRVGDPKNWTISEYIRLVLFLSHVLVMYLSPPWVSLVIFLFWRFMYDGFLGVLLRNQSRRRSFSRWYRAQRASGGYWGGLLHRAVVGTIGASNAAKLASLPMDYEAWLAFRELSDIILNLDTGCYVVFGLKYIEAPTAFTFWTIVSYLFALVLIVISVWAKLDALRVLGDFAWHWADFFFLLLEVDLSFEGVFEMFPHPMYSVGYFFYYGAAIIAQSYTVLWVSLFAHLLQMVFLALVENPHIERTYGGDKPKAADETTARARYSIFFGQDVLLLKNLNLFRASDVLMLLLVLHVPLLGALDLSLSFYFGLAVLWRLIHTVGTGVVLHKQSNSQWFTNAYVAQGSSIDAAFYNWKALYNITLLMSHASFALCCLEWWARATHEFTFGSILFRLPVAFILISIGLWSASAVLDVLGEFGWFYGDFFYGAAASASLSYQGIYRFLNNPDTITGFFLLYGLALLADSPAMVSLALFSQGCHWAFVMLVEKPHMKRLYGDQERKEGGIEKNVKSRLLLIRERKAVRRVLEHPIAQRAKETIEATRSVLKEATLKASDQLTSIGRTASELQNKAKVIIDETKTKSKKLKATILPEPRDDDSDEDPVSLGSPPRSPLPHSASASDAEAKKNQ